jgi:hypothetical protein
MINTEMTEEANIKQLESMKTSIDMMSKMNHVEILKILKDNNVKLNENKSGIFINLSFLSIDVVDKIMDFIDFIQQREKLIEIVEKQKIELSITIKDIPQ